MHTVTLTTGRTFPADTGTSVLEAARANGVVLEHSCRNGRCGACKAPLISGETVLLRPEVSLAPQEAAEGTILTCCRGAAGDLTLDVESLDRLADVPVVTVPSRIVSLERVAEDLLKVVLRTPPATPLRFLPGQYVDVIAEGMRRSYSLANAPRVDNLLELLVKRYAGGAMSAFWFERAVEGALIRLEGPLGTFFLRDEGPRELVFLATGTGIAPVKALLEELAAAPERAAKHRISVYWGNRDPRAFCWDPVGLDLNMRFERVLSGSEPNWIGRRGWVQDAAMRDGLSFEDAVVYACGSEAMIASARSVLKGRGLPPRRFFSDAFVSSN